MSLPIIGDRVGSSGGSEGLPPGYTRLDYLQSTGTQYIKTNFFVPADGLYLWADVQFVEPNDFTAGNESFFDYNNTPSTGVNFGSQADQRYDLFNWWGNYGTEGGWPTYEIRSSKAVNSRSIYEVKDLTVSYGPQQISIASNGRGVDSEVPFLIFGNYKSGSEEINPFGRWNMRIFEMKLGLRDGTIVRHLVPVLDSDGRPCLHDLISEQTFYNGGTGEFLFQIHADLPNGYTKVEYLKSTGTQWIDTGIVPDEFTGAYLIAEGSPNGDVYPMGALDTSIMGTGIPNYRWWLPSGTRPGGNHYGWKTYIAVGLNSGTGIFIGTLNWFSSQKMSYQLPSQKGYIVTNLTQWNELNETGGCTISLYTLSGLQSCMGAFKIYSAAISHKDKIICNFVPALDLDNRPCMFDTISRTPFYSESSEDFQWG